MKILVTGGSGFIGSALVRKLLALGHEVTIYDKVDSRVFPKLVVEGDIRDEKSLTRAVANKDVVYHLAAEHADDVRPVSLYSDVNIGGARNLVAAAETTGLKKIIFTSSVAIYGLNANTPNEECPANPFNEYGRTKLEAEKILSAWLSKEKDRALTIIRPCVIFGEGNRGNVYNLLRQIHSGNFLMVGNGLNKKSMGYVLNIADFLSGCSSNEQCLSIFNYADKPDLTTRQLVDIARDAFGLNPLIKIRVPYFFGIAAGRAMDILALITRKTYPLSSIRIKKFCADTTIETTRLEKIGFIPPYDLTRSLKRTIKNDHWNK